MAVTHAVLAVYDMSNQPLEERRLAVLFEFQCCHRHMYMVSCRHAIAHHSAYISTQATVKPGWAAGIGRDRALEGTCALDIPRRGSPGLGGPQDSFAKSATCRGVVCPQGPFFAIEGLDVLTGSGEFPTHEQNLGSYFYWAC